MRAATERLRRACRNLGRPGIGAMAIAAIDTALWDLKARLLDLPLVVLLGCARDGVPVYGSGGFTSLTERELTEQLAGWVADGIPRVKMKIGREPERDPERVAAARAAVGDDCSFTSTRTAPSTAAGSRRSSLPVDSPRSSA